MILLIVGGFLALLYGYFTFYIARFGRASNKGIAALKAGRLEEAEHHFQEALKIALAMRDNGRSDVQVVAWLHLSAIASKRGQDEEAIRRAGHAIEAMPIVRCGNTANFPKVFAHIADILEQHGEFNDAVQFRQLEVRTTPAQTALDANHVTGSLIKLARALKDADRPAEAVVAYESVCKLPQSSNIPHARMEMASMLRKLGRFDEAEQQHRQAVESFRSAGAKEELNLAVALSNFGVFYSDRQRFAEAITVYQESLDIRRRLFGESSSRYAVTENNLANCLRKFNRLEEAAAHAKSSMAVLRAENHKAFPNSLDTMGLTLRDSGHLAEAETCLVEACAILKARPDRDTDDYKKFSEHHAEILERLERHAEAAVARAEAQSVNEDRKVSRPLAEILDPVIAPVLAGMRQQA